jgi:hypothetical protein
VREIFLGEVPFWEWGEIAAGMSAGMSQVFDLNPQPSGKRRLRHPQNRGVAERNCGVVGEDVPPTKISNASTVRVTSLATVCNAGKTA